MKPVLVLLRHGDRSGAEAGPCAPLPLALSLASGGSRVPIWNSL